MSRINPRVTAAAARLALFYSAFIALETLVLVLALGPQAWPLIELVPVAVIFLAVPFFFGAFLLLVVARGLGLIAFWILLLSFWVFLLNSIPSLEFPQSFVFWSILALPIWLIGHLGISDRSSSRLHLGSVRVSPAAALLACWALMIAGARLYGPLTDEPAPSIPIAKPLAWIWAVAPIVLCVFASWHVWRGTAMPRAVVDQSLDSVT